MSCDVKTYRDGFEVGFDVGWMEGAEVGVRVGASVVGAVVGRIVGVAEGVDVGWFVGCSVGWVVGCKVGLLVGVCEEGWSVGAPVGWGVVGAGVPSNVPPAHTHKRGWGLEHAHSLVRPSASMTLPLKHPFCVQSSQLPYGSSASPSQTDGKPEKSSAAVRFSPMVRPSCRWTVSLSGRPSVAPDR